MHILGLAFGGKDLQILAKTGKGRCMAAPALLVLWVGLHGQPIYSCGKEEEEDFIQTAARFMPYGKRLVAGGKGLALWIRQEENLDPADWLA